MSRHGQLAAVRVAIVVLRASGLVAGTYISWYFRAVLRNSRPVAMQCP